MLYGTPSHAAHRATSGVVLVRGFASGQHRTRPHRTHAQRRARRDPERAAQFLSRALAAMIVLGLTAMAGFFMVADERHGPEAIAAGRDPLASRAVDPVPLSVGEVFPDSVAARPAASPAYQISVTHSDTDCGRATTGTLGAVLAGYGCDQVVRAALAAPYSGFRVTAGLFNLADADGAAAVDDMVRRLVETGDGGFAALADDPDASPTSPVGWRVRGHYLLYCVITGPGGTLVAGDDPYVERITSELVDGYLADALARRASGA
jgi:hypothetical protein